MRTRHTPHTSASAAARAPGAGAMECLVEATPAVREALRRATEAAGGQWEVRRRSERRDSGATRLVTAEAAGRAMPAPHPASSHPCTSKSTHSHQPFAACASER